MYAKSGVNVRDLPSTDGNKIGSLSASQSVTVTGQCNETSWYRIEYNGSIGYVRGNYLVSEIPTQTPTQKPTNSYIEYAPAGEVFTDSTSVTIDGQLITVTSDMKIGNTIIAENLSGDDVRIQVDGDALGFYQSKSVRDVYSDIYGEENVAVDWGEAGDYTILITRTYEYAPAGEVFTDSTSITIDGQPITVTGSTKIHNTIIAENLSGVNIKIKVGKSG